MGKLINLTVSKVGERDITAESKLFNTDKIAYPVFNDGTHSFIFVKNDSKVDKFGVDENLAAILALVTDAVSVTTTAFNNRTFADTALVFAHHLVAPVVSQAVVGLTDDADYSATVSKLPVDNLQGGTDEYMVSDTLATIKTALDELVAELNIKVVDYKGFTTSSASLANPQPALFSVERILAPIQEVDGDSVVILKGHGNAVPTTYLVDETIAAIETEVTPTP